MVRPNLPNPVDQAEGAISQSVAGLYNAYPFPPEPLLDEAPPGYNWRWYYPAAYAFCTGQAPVQRAVRILDAGCGTGVSTDYLTHLNPAAEVIGIDLSLGAIAVAEERCQRSGATRAQFLNLSLYDIDQLPGEFDHINCVGVLHHLPDPVRGIQALARKLAPGGILHVFVYGQLGRFEIQLMQEAIALLQGDQRGDYRDGVAVGRQIFASLPATNRLVRREQERWAMENHRDECFADMYVHPQEFDYTIDSLFELIDASGLAFLGFSNPEQWDIQRLLGADPDLMERYQRLNPRQRYRLVEILDPESFTHYEFFLGKLPLEQVSWQDEARLLGAIPERNPCMYGWPSRGLLNQNYRPVELHELGYALLEACDANGDRPVEQRRCLSDLLQETGAAIAEVQALLQQQLILLVPAVSA